MGRVTRFALSITLIFAAITVVSFILHWVLWPFFPGHTLALPELLSLSTTYKTDTFHVSYLLMVSITLALISAIWLAIFAPRFQRLQPLQIAIIPFLALWTAGVLCSILWAIRAYWAFHDVRPVPLPNLHQIACLSRIGVEQGLVLAPSIVLRSFPWNVLWYSFAYLVITVYRKWWGYTDQASVC